MPTNLIGLSASEEIRLHKNCNDLPDGIELVYQVEYLYEALTSTFTKVDEGYSPEMWFAVTQQLKLCRMLVTKSVLSLMRDYQCDSLLHLRKAIEACAFMIRISKYPDLGVIWAKGGQGTKEYEEYRSAFSPRDVFPRKTHKDHEDLLELLKSEYDLCSKMMHGSILGVVGHVIDATEKQPGWISFFDPPHSTAVVVGMVLGTHLLIVESFATHFWRRTSGDRDAWSQSLAKARSQLKGFIEKHHPFFADGKDGQPSATKTEREST